MGEVLKEREAAQAKHSRITAEVDELKASLAGGCKAGEDLLNKINKLEEIKTDLVIEINNVNAKINAEKENIEGFDEGLKKTGSNQSSLGREMRNVKAVWLKNKMKS